MDRRSAGSRLPTVDEIEGDRDKIDGRIREALSAEDVESERVAELVEIGLRHEQQHQELLATDLLHMFGQNPLYPEVFGEVRLENRRDSAPTRSDD